MSAPTAAEIASADIQAQYDELTANIEDCSAQHDAAVADEQSATDTDAMALAGSRCTALARRIERLKGEREALEEPLRRARALEVRELCERARAEAQEQGAEAIAELDAVVCEFARKVAPILDEINAAEERAYQAAHGLNQYASRGGHLNRHWHRYGDGGFLFNATQMALEHLKQSERRS